MAQKYSKTYRHNKRVEKVDLNDEITSIGMSTYFKPGNNIE